MEDIDPQKTQLVLSLPKAPKFSNNLKKIGNTTQLVTNMFPIQYKGNDKVYVYSIDIEPEIPADSRQLRERILKSIQRQMNNDFNDKTDKRIEQGLNMFSFQSIDHPLVYEGFAKNKDQEKINYTVTIKQVNAVSFKDLNNLGQGNATTMILNSYVKETLKSMKYTEIGKNGKFYDLSQQWTQQVDRVQGQDVKLYVWRGFKTSSFLCPDSQYLQIDFASRVLRDETVLDFITYFGLPQSIEMLIGRTVIADYGNSAMYRIDDIDTTKNPLSTFPKKDGTEITFQQYFKEQYGKQIKNLKQPLIVYRDKKIKRDIILIPELVLLTGLEDKEKANFKVMQAISQYTKLTPRERMQQIEDFAQKINDAPNKVFQFKNPDDIPTCEGYVLNAPKVHLGQSYVEPSSGNFRPQQKIFSPVSFTDWLFVYSSNGKRDDDEVDALVDDMIKASKAFGIFVKQPGFITIKGYNPEEYIREIGKDIQKNGKPQIVVTLIDRKQKASCYTKFKEYFYVIQGIPHSNIVKESLFKNRMSVLSNILLQMNAKMNQPLWRLEQPIGMPQNIMIIGVDIFHKRVQRKNSCVGFVASMNSDINEFYSRILITPEGQELVTSLSQLVNDAVLKYHQINKNMPQTIFMYRDGVGDSQVQNVLDKEVIQVINGFARIDEDYKPQMAYLLVNKKNFTKFFSQEDVKGGGRGGKGRIAFEYKNPQSGTIVCKEIVTNNFDFFLAAQNVNSKQGTCTPTHYTVAYNSTNLPQDFFHQLTYFQTFNYFNWPGAVRVPACVMYAKKLSYLIGETFKQDVNKKLDEYLYYL